MKLKSLIENSNRLEVAEVEVEFIPGIPQIHFLGLPDRIIKESFYRIKSAMRAGGYKFPLTNQVIVNIKPNHLRKSSRGVELAVLLAILAKSDQLPADFLKPDWVIYGELGLDGRIYEPTDLNQNLYLLQGESILTGAEVLVHDTQAAEVMRLESIEHFELQICARKLSYRRPQAGLNRMYSEDEAELLFLAAVSGLHVLLAGDAGAGKSTLAQSLVSFLPEPQEDEVIRQERNWRPMLAPHHSMTSAAFLGGGANLYEGELERAQGGLLVLDEFLEFAPEIIESLRGPMTGDRLRLVRASQKREVRSEFQVVATSNLCICGKWTPLKKNVNCRYSRLRCTRYLERLSGPMLDRFGLLMFCSSVRKRQVSGQEILTRIENYRGFEKSFREQADGLKWPAFIYAYYGHLSERRRIALKKISQIYWIEEQGQTHRPEAASGDAVEMSHINKAEKWVIKPFELLEKGMN